MWIITNESKARCGCTQPSAFRTLASVAPSYLFISILTTALWTVSAQAGKGFHVQSSNTPASWTIEFNNQKLLVYSCDPQKFKSYVKELYTLNGDNVLRDSPFDHLHHHGLMYAIRVNGLNFWEEISGSAVEKSIEAPEPQLGFITREGHRLPQARITQVLHWVASQDAFLPKTNSGALLLEHRTLLLTVDSAHKEVALEWKSHFEVGNKTNTVVLTGSTYNGLGMRFPQPLDSLAVHSIAGVRPDLSKNRQDLSIAPWAAVSFDAPGHPATIALAGHPSNTRGDATFFSMLTPFAYLSATQSLDKEPLVYHSGDQFEINYLVLVYPESKPSDYLRSRIDLWRQAKPCS